MGKRLTWIVLSACCLTAAPGLADIVPISSSEQINGSGSVEICDVPLPLDFCPVVAENSFTGVPGSATASGFAFGIMQELTSSTYLQPVPISISSDNINVQIGVGASVAGLVKRGGGNAEASELYHLEFDLTSPSLMHLTGSVTESAFGNTISYSSVTQLVLSGPEFQFKTPPPDSFDFSFALEPGIYDLIASTEASINTGSNYDGLSLSIATLSMNADFVTAIPEARYSPLLPGLLVIVWLLSVRGKKPASPFRDIDKERSAPDPHREGVYYPNRPIRDLPDSTLISLTHREPA